MVAWNKVSKLVDRCGPVGLQLGLVSEAQELLLTMSYRLEASPSIFVEQVMILCIDGAGDWIICSNDIERFKSGLLSLPIN